MGANGVLITVSGYHNDPDPNKRLFTRFGEYLRGATIGQGTSSGTGHDPNTIAATPDGLYIIGAAPFQNAAGVIVVDQYFSTLSIPIHDWGCVAANLKGDIYQVGGKKVMIYERE